MASQYGEDKRILSYFEGRKGRFLDIGAGDGLTFSNTAPLVDVGWSGVMVEPALDQLRWLLENHGQNPAVDIVPGVLTPSSQRGRNWEAFFECRDFSSAVQHHVDKIMEHSQGACKFRGRFAPTISWCDLTRLYGGGFNFINIDVEGWNTNVLGDCPILDLVEMVCIELDPVEELPLMRRILEGAGLKHNDIVGGNLLAWR